MYVTKTRTLGPRRKLKCKRKRTPFPGLRQLVAATPQSERQRLCDEEAERMIARGEPGPALSDWSDDDDEDAELSSDGW